MEYMLKLSSPSGTITLNYGDNQASRGATVAGLGRVRDQLEIEAWDVDENGKSWVKVV
jgi:hypothetical protein